MTWKQPPKKLVTPVYANFMTFVKPHHGGDPASKSPTIKCSGFDPWQPQHRTTNMDAVNKLLTSVEKSFLNTGL